MEVFGAARFGRAVARAHAWLSPPALVLMYHRVSAVRRDPWQLAVTPAHFAEHLEVIRRHGRPLLVRDLTRSLGTGRAPGRAIILTLNGYADNLLEARPLLERHDVPATVFVAAGCLGRPSFWWDDLERVILTSTDLPPHLRIVVRGEAHEWDRKTTCTLSTRRPVEGCGLAGRDGASDRASSLVPRAVPAPATALRP